MAAAVRMSGMIAALAAVSALVMGVFLAAPASAGPPPPGCERVPILGLNPKVREICDMPIQADGSWERWRWFWAPELVSSTCGGIYVGYDDCPQWSKNRASSWTSPVEKYIVTADVIPPGEPGYIGG